MGIYVYRVTAKTKTMADGTKANIAVYAYKLHGYMSETEQNTLHRVTGGYVADRYVRDSKNYTGRVCLTEDGDVAVNCHLGTFTDSWFDRQLEKVA